MVEQTTQDAIPGLAPPAPADGPLVLAVRATLDHAAAERSFTKLETATVQLAIELAQIIEDKRRTRKTSTVSNDARLLDEIVARLTGADSDVDSDVDAQLRAAMAEWSDFVETERNAAAS